MSPPARAHGGTVAWRAQGLSLVAAGLALSLGCGCAEAPQRPPAPFSGPAPLRALASDPAVARVDDQPIHESEAVARARQRNLPPSGENATLVSEDLVTEDLLAAEARRQGLQAEPLVRDALRRAVVQALLADDFEPRVTPATVPEELLQRLYKSNFWYYNRPELRSFEHLLVRCVRTQPPPQHAAARALAETLLRLARARPGRPLAEWSDEAAQRAAAAGLQVSLETGRQPRSQLEVEFGDLLYALPLGQLGERVVQSRFGYHLVRTTAIDAPVERPYADVRADVLANAWPTYRQARFQQWLRELRARFGARTAETAHLLFRDAPAGAR